MTRLSFLGAVSIVALGILVLLFLDDRTTRTAPTTAECIALWNGPANTTSQAEVAERRYPAAEIGGAFSEDRYQGCFALFATDVGEPWALYSATRIPGSGQPLRWRLDVAEERWGEGMQLPPRDEPRSNADVEDDGSVSRA